jgi:nicotinate-nucleotide pyrophosphorylase
MAESHIVEKVMDRRHRLHRIQPIEFEVSAIESFREVAVAWEVFLLDLELRRRVITVVHIVGSVDSRANVQAMGGVLGISISHMELCLLLIAGVLRVRVDSFLFQSLPNYLTLDEFFSPFEVIHGAHDF